MPARVHITRGIRIRVRRLIGQGMTRAQVAAAVEISESTLARRCQKELTEGKAAAIATVSEKLFDLCAAGNLGAICFYLKCVGAWREVQRVEATGADGAPLFAPQSILVVPVLGDGSEQAWEAACAAQQVRLARAADAEPEHKERD